VGSDRSLGDDFRLPIQPAQHRFDIDDRRTVQRLEVANAKPVAVDHHDLDAVQPDRVGTISRSSAEDSPLRVGRIVAWMYPQDTPLGAVEPSQDQDLVAFFDPFEASRQLGVEYEPRVGRPFVSLLGRGHQVDQRGLDGSDRDAS
jgi:hypothetical protein